MSDFGGAYPRALAMKSGTLAAATVLAGAGLIGVMPAAPPFAVAATVQQDVALAADGTGSSFFDAVQNLLGMMQLGTVDQVLAIFGKVPAGFDGAGDPFDAGSTVAALLRSLNPGALTLGQTFGQLGIPLNLELYTDSGESLLGSETFTVGGLEIANPFVFTAPDSFYTTVWPGDDPGNLYSSINGTPLGDVDLGKLVDLLLGGAGQGDDHSLAELAGQLGFDLNQSLPSTGGLSDILSWFTGGTYAAALNNLGGLLGNFNVVTRGCLLVCGGWEPTDLTVNSSLNDWLSGLLRMPTTDVTQITTGTGAGTTVDADSAKTLGDYLQSLAWGDSTTTHLADQNLGGLLGMTDADINGTWDQYLANMLFGGIFFHPGTALGDQTIGGLLESWLPDGTVPAAGEIGTMPITDILEAFFQT